MSYSFDVLERVWRQLEDKLPPHLKEGEIAMRFGFLLNAIHDANHKVNDAINHDERVTKLARKLDDVSRIENNWKESKE